jgi:hypothetical protein
VLCAAKTDFRFRSFAKIFEKVGYTAALRLITRLIITRKPSDITVNEIICKDIDCLLAPKFKCPLFLPKVVDSGVFHGQQDGVEGQALDGLQVSWHIWLKTTGGHAEHLGHLL